MLLFDYKIPVEADRALRDAYVALAFAFRRLEGSARSRDTELCSTLLKVRAEIERVLKAQDAAPAEALAAPSPSQEALREGRDEYGWLIEHGTSPVSSPAYYAGGGHWAKEPWSSAWTSNHLHAIRFARKLDAERFAERAMAGIPVRVCEHAWDAALAQSAPVKAGG